MSEEFRAYEVYYVDDNGEEHELGALIATSEEDARRRAKRFIYQQHGVDEVRAWQHYGPRIREG